jgi:hypothetical protein
VYKTYFVGSDSFTAYVTMELNGPKWREKYRQRFSEIRMLAEAITTVKDVLSYSDYPSAVAWWTLREKKPLVSLPKVGTTQQADAPA